MPTVAFEVDTYLVKPILIDVAQLFVSEPGSYTVSVTFLTFQVGW
jgi:hypothetical protein